MTLFYLLSLPAMIVIFLTAVARLDDIGRDKKGAMWNVRRLGFFLSAVFAILMMAMPFTESGTSALVWVVAIGVNGQAMVWLTTPATQAGVPPWHMLITGEYRKEGVVFRTLSQRIRHEIAGVWWSFRHTTHEQRQQRKK